MKYTKENPKLVDRFFDFEGMETFTGVVKDNLDIFAYYENGSFHREDGPALEHNNGSKEWYLNGKCHREDGPAIEYPNGNKYYYLNNRYYGDIKNDHFTNESWIRFIKLELLK